MLCGPLGCTATAVCVLCLNSLPNTECASCGLGLPALCVCTAEVLDLEKPRRLQALPWHDQPEPSPAAASPGWAQTLTLLPLGLPGAGLGSWWSTGPEGKGTHRRRVSPQSSVIYKMLYSAGYVTECVTSLNYAGYQDRAPSLATLKCALKWSVEQLWAIQETKTLSASFPFQISVELVSFLILNIYIYISLFVNCPSFVHCRPWVRFQVSICCLERYRRKESEHLNYLVTFFSNRDP